MSIPWESCLTVGVATWCMRASPGDTAPRTPLGGSDTAGSVGSVRPPRLPRPPAETPRLDRDAATGASAPWWDPVSVVLRDVVEHIRVW